MRGPGGGSPGSRAPSVDFCLGSLSSAGPRVGCAGALDGIDFDGQCSTPSGDPASRNRPPREPAPPRRRWPRPSRTRRSGHRRPRGRATRRRSPGACGAVGAGLRSAPAEQLDPAVDVHRGSRVSGPRLHSPPVAPCRPLESSSGSVENLNVAVRQGCRSHLRQIRATVAKELVSSPAGSRADQCVTPQMRWRTAVLGEGGHHHVDLVDLRRPPSARHVLQRPDTARVVPRPPVHHGRPAGPGPPRDLRVRQPLGRGLHDPRPRR